MSDGVPVMWMRGGTSKGGYFLASDLPADPATRDRLLLRIMGSPDPRQIDGMGGGDPLTSKVAVISAADDPDVDVNYLFLQVFVDQAIVTDAQNCGNILAGVGPFAIERGLVAPGGEVTEVRIHMVNTGQRATANVATPNGRVSYAGTAAIDGVPGRAAAVPLVFSGTAGATCGALLPTGNPVDEIDGLAVTMIDDGMPVVILAAADLGLAGDEAPEDLEAGNNLKTRLESLRLEAGARMGLGDVAAQSVPKITLVSRPRAGGTIATRTFIPHRVHRAIGVFGALSVGTACLLDRGPAAEFAEIDGDTLSIEHPTGAFGIVVNRDRAGAVTSCGVLRTARKLMDGVAFG